MQTSALLTLGDIPTIRSLRLTALRDNVLHRGLYKYIKEQLCYVTAKEQNVCTQIIRGLLVGAEKG